jgi:glycosyltransferase 2 family protein
LISLVLLALLSTLVDFSEVLSTLATLHPGYVLLILGLVTLDRFFMAFKYNVLLKARGLHVPFVHVLKTYYIGNFMGFFLPATVGMDAVRIWHLSQYGYNVAIVTSAVLIERLLGLRRC